MHGIRLPHLKKTIVRTNPMVMATTIPVSDSINESPVNKEKICPSPNVTEDTIIATLFDGNWLTFPKPFAQQIVGKDTIFYCLTLQL